MGNSQLPLAHRLAGRPYLFRQLFLGQAQAGTISLRRGKKPTRKQKIRLGQAGLSPENWLVVKQKQNGELVILHKHTDTIRVVPPLGQ